MVTAPTIFPCSSLRVGGGHGEGLGRETTAGLGVAFHAKPKVKEQAQVGISTLGLDGILYLLGIRDSEASTKVKQEILYPVKRRRGIDGTSTGQNETAGSSGSLFSSMTR